ncbi:MAG: hypothetical protein ACLU8W_04820 [Clostridia bacterium]
MSREKKVKKQKAKGTQRAIAAILIILAIGSLIYSAAGMEMLFTKEEFNPSQILLGIAYLLEGIFFFVLGIICRNKALHPQARQAVSGIVFLAIACQALVGFIGTVSHFWDYDLSDPALYMYLIPRVASSAICIALAVFAFIRKPTPFKLLFSIIYALSIIVFYVQDILSSPDVSIVFQLLTIVFEIAKPLIVMIGVLGPVERQQKLPPVPSEN